MENAVISFILLYVTERYYVITSADFANIQDKKLELCRYKLSALDLYLWMIFYFPHKQEPQVCLFHRRAGG